MGRTEAGKDACGRAVGLADEEGQVRVVFLDVQVVTRDVLPVAMSIRYTRLED